MLKFENISQDIFDKIKIFFISNYSMIFQNSDDSSVLESFEITTSKCKILGNYKNDGTLELDSDDNADSEFEMIKSNFVKISSDITANTIDDSPHDKSLIDFLSQSKSLFDHVTTCQECQKKLAEILKHSEN